MTKRSRTPRETPSTSSPPAAIVLVTDVGASVALHDILLELPADFNIPLVVLQPAETVLFEANLSALERTVPFRIHMLKSTATLVPGTVYVGQAERSYQLNMKGDLPSIGLEDGSAAEWPTGNSLRQFSVTLGSRLTVAFFSTLIDGFNLQQLVTDLSVQNSNLIFVTSNSTSDAGFSPSGDDRISSVNDTIELAGLLAKIARPKSGPDVKNQVAQSFRR